MKYKNEICLIGIYDFTVNPAVRLKEENFTKSFLILSRLGFNNKK